MYMEGRAAGAGWGLASDNMSNVAGDQLGASIPRPCEADASGAEPPFVTYWLELSNPDMIAPDQPRGTLESA